MRHGFPIPCSVKKSRFVLWECHTFYPSLLYIIILLELVKIQNEFQPMRLKILNDSLGIWYLTIWFCCGLFLLKNPTIRMWYTAPREKSFVWEILWSKHHISCKQVWYCLSKTLAEEAAWVFSKQNSIDLVVMNPGYVIGPILQPTLNYTSKTFLNLIKGISNDLYVFPQIQTFWSIKIIFYYRKQSISMAILSISRC